MARSVGLASSTGEPPPRATAGRGEGALATVEEAGGEQGRERVAEFASVAEAVQQFAPVTSGPASWQALLTPQTVRHDSQPLHGAAAQAPSKRARTARTVIDRTLRLTPLRIGTLRRGRATCAEGSHPARRGGTREQGACAAGRGLSYRDQKFSAAASDSGRTTRKATAASVRSRPPGRQ